MHYLLSCKGAPPDQRTTLGIQSCTFACEFVSWRHLHFDAFDRKLALSIVIQRPTVLPPRISIPAVVNIAQETEWFICESVCMRCIVWSDSLQIVWVLHDEISIFFQSQRTVVIDLGDEMAFSTFACVAPCVITVAVWVPRIVLITHKRCCDRTWVSFASLQQIYLSSQALWLNPRYGREP